MKLPLISILLALAAPVFADDVALTKAAFEKFVQFQQADDRKILDLISADGSGRIISSDGELEIVSEIPEGKLVRAVEAAILQDDGEPEPYEKVEFKASGDTVSASGFIRYTKPDFEGPFSMDFTKNAAGEMKITSMTITIPLSKTPVKGHGLFGFVMPGKWSPADVNKQEVGEGRTMYPGMGSGQGGSLAYFAFQDATTKPEDQDLKAFPAVVGDPIVKRLTAQGGKEDGRWSFTDLTPGNKDQGYFIRTLTDPGGNRVFISGIVLRTKARIYLIQTIAGSLPGVKLWRSVAESFKEL